MKQHRGPFPVVAFEELMDANVLPPMFGAVSGEITASITGAVLGAARKAGRVSDVFLSVGESGKDDGNDLKITGNVYINGATCLSTRPVIAHVSGESSQVKTTKVSGDTGIVQAVVDMDANSVSEGDLITYDIALDRTEAPTAEIAQAAVVVEFDPPS